MPPKVQMPKKQEAVKRQEPFKKPKIKVGKKLPKNLNLTKINLKISKVKVPDQVSQYEDHDTETNIKMIFSKYRLNKDISKSDSLSGLYTLLRRDSSSCRYLIDYESSLIDFAKSFNEKTLRTGLEILSFYLKFQFDHNSIRSFFIQSLWSNMRMLFSYIDNNVRESSIKFFMKNSHIFASYYSSNEYNKYSFISEILEEFTSSSFINIKEINCSNFSDFFQIASLVLQTKKANSDQSLNNKLEILSLMSTKNFKEKKQEIIPTLEDILHKFLHHFHSIFISSTEISFLKENLAYLSNSATLAKHLLLILDPILPPIPTETTQLINSDAIHSFVNELDLRGYLTGNKPCKKGAKDQTIELSSSQLQISKIFIKLFSYIILNRDSLIQVDAKYICNSLVQSLTKIFDLLLTYKNYFCENIKFIPFEFIFKYLKFVCSAPVDCITANYDLLISESLISLNFCTINKISSSKLLPFVFTILKSFDQKIHDFTSTLQLVQLLGKMFDDNLFPEKLVKKLYKNYKDACENINSNIDTSRENDLTSALNSNIIASAISVE